MTQEPRPGRAAVGYSAAHRTRRRRRNGDVRLELRPPRDPDAIVLVVSGSIRRTAISGLCRRAQLLIAGSDAEVVYLDVGALADGDAVVVEALARLRVTVARLGRRLALTEVPPGLAAVVAFMGLADVLEIAGRRDDRAS